MRARGSAARRTRTRCAGSGGRWSAPTAPRSRPRSTTSTPRSCASRACSRAPATSLARQRALEDAHVVEVAIEERLAGRDPELVSGQVQLLYRLEVPVGDGDA